MRRLLLGCTAMAGIGGVLLLGAASPAKADDCDRYYRHDRYRYERARYEDRYVRDCDRDRYYRTDYRDYDRYRGSNVRVDLDLRLGNSRIVYRDRGHRW